MDWPMSAVACSAIGSLLIGLAGIFPLLFVNKHYAGKLNKYKHS